MEQIRVHTSAREAAPDVGRPDWVLLGLPQADGSVAVYGSVEMSEAELRMERDVIEHSEHGMIRLEPGKARYYLSTQMKTIVYAAGPTYAEALRDLFTFWSADERRSEPTRELLP